MAHEDAFKSFWNALKAPDLAKLDWANLDWKESTETLRGYFQRANKTLEPDLPRLAEISNLTVDGADGPLKARLYVPLGAGIAPAPAIVFFHGGGFVLGDLDSYDALCIRLAAAARCRLISIDYRLAPEHKFPSAHEDAKAAWHWIINHADRLGFDKNRICVCGDSAGGNLSAYLSQEMQRTGGPAPAFQLLFYPLVQFADIRTKKLSFQEGGFFISPSLFDYYRDSYIAEETARMDKRVSPLFAPEDEFAGLPPAHIVLCGWDPLRDEGRAYGAKLAAQGIAVSMREYDDMVHGFLNMTAISKTAREAITDAGHIVGKALGARS